MMEEDMADMKAGVIAAVMRGEATGTRGEGMAMKAGVTGTKEAATAADTIMAAVAMATLATVMMVVGITEMDMITVIVGVIVMGITGAVIMLPLLHRTSR